jgi:hypothetical protein
VSKILVLRDESGRPPDGGTDEQRARIGMVFWPLTFKHTEDLFEARRRFVLEMVKSGGAEHVRLGLFSAMQSTQWAHFGYPTLSAGHKFAAALMATSARLDSLEDVHVPWFAFRCIVPDGLLALGPHPIDRIMVSRIIVDPSFTPTLNTLKAAEERVVWQASLYHRDGGIAMELFDETLHGLLTEAATDHVVARVSDVGTQSIDPIGPADKKPADRLALLAQRYVLGLIINLQQHPSFGADRERPTGPSERPGREGAPKHRIFFLGHPITVDCRPAIASYLAGERHAPPSVQTLVRGHWKRQVVGVGRSGRKIIHVEPYWRGPEDAPILVHEYVMGKEQST